METVSALLALCEGKPLVIGGFTSHKVGNDVALISFFMLAPQSVEQTAEFRMIWYAMALTRIWAAVNHNNNERTVDMVDIPYLGTINYGLSK